MPVTDLMLDGVNLMLLGMGTVFTFLVILVAAMEFMSRLASKLSSDTQPGSATPVPLQQPAGNRDDEELTAVISAAISRFRSTHN